jgi:hypothetical protein
MASSPRRPRKETSSSSTPVAIRPQSLSTRVKCSTYVHHSCVHCGNNKDANVCNAPMKADGRKIAFSAWKLSADMRYVMFKTDHKKVRLAVPESCWFI